MSYNQGKRRLMYITERDTKQAFLQTNFFQIFQECTLNRKDNVYNKQVLWMPCKHVPLNVEDRLRYPAIFTEKAIHIK